MTKTNYRFGVMKAVDGQRSTVDDEQMTFSNFLIEHQCPQCGAPATLTETDRLFECPFCRVSSYLMPGDYFRYVIPHRTGEDKELIYFPYWRFKGMLFSCASSVIQPRFIDVSHQAVASDVFPISVGFRSQTQKLRFVSNDIKGRFLTPDRSKSDILAGFEDRFHATLPKPIYHQAQIGESLSLLYAPFYVASALMDAVLNEPVAQPAPEDIHALTRSATEAPWHLKFIPTLCPNCNWDLSGERDALVLLCRNCQSAWMAGKTKLHQIPYGFFPSDGGEVLYLPFWRISADTEGIALQSYADLVKAANLPKVSQPEWHRKPFYFWSPGFKIRPQTFLPLATKITLVQPEAPTNQKLPFPDALYSVNLPLQEALESLRIILAGFIKPRKTLWPRLSSLRIVPKKFSLIYLPFNIGHHDFTQPLCRFTIAKSQLALAKNL